MNRASTPRMIAVVGIDGSGKSTFVEILRQSFEDRQLKVNLCDWFRDPQIRDLATCFNETNTMTPAVLAALHAGATLAQVQAQQTIDADIILWDRYVYSSYASCRLRGAPVNLMERLVAAFPVPDLVIHFVADPLICFERIKARGNPLRFYESGLDRLFRGRAQEAHQRFDADGFSEKLVQEVFIETMAEWNQRLTEIIPKHRCLRLQNFNLSDACQLCDTVLAQLNAETQ